MEEGTATIKREQYKLMMSERHNRIQRKIAYKRTSKDGDRCFGCAALYGAAVYKKTTTYFKKTSGVRKRICKECKTREIIHDLTPEVEEEVRMKWASISDDPFYELEFTVVQEIGIDRTPESTKSRPGETHEKERDGEFGVGRGETKDGELGVGATETRDGEPETRENERQMARKKRDIKEAELMEELAEIMPYSQNSDSGTEWERLEGIKEMLATAVREYEGCEAERRELCILCDETLRGPNIFGDFL